MHKHNNPAKSSFRSHLGGQAGQVGLIIILTMTVLLTVGLSVASRSSQELSFSTAEKEANRVFSAAESGIEAALSQLNAGQTVGGPLTGFNGIDAEYKGSESDILESKIFEGVAVKVDLTGAENGDILRLDWSKESNCATAAPASLIVSIFYDQAGITRVRHLAYAACDHGDGFTLGDAGSSPYYRSANIPLATNDLFAHIKTIYNDSHLRISASGWVAPTQSYRVTAKAQNTVGNESKIIAVDQTLKTTPSIADYALLSGSTLVK